LQGELCGDITPVIETLRAELGRHEAGTPLVIDCHALLRVDFPAAGSLLQWLLDAVGRGVQPELHGLNRLVAAFFHVVGIDEAATLQLREY